MHTSPTAPCSATTCNPLPQAVCAASSSVPPLLGCCLGTRKTAVLAMGTPTGMLGPGPPLQSLSRSDLWPAQARFCVDEAMSTDNNYLA